MEKYDEAVRELRTHRRISGSNDNIALIADAERGRGKPQKAIELFESAGELDLDHATRTELVIVAAGAKSDLGDPKGARALIEAEDFTQKPSGALVRLMAAYSGVLRLHGETEMADKYEALSRRTAKATGTLFGDEEPDPNLGVEIETVDEVEEIPEEEISDEEIAAPEDEAVDEAAAESVYGSGHDVEAVGMAAADDRDEAELDDAAFDETETSGLGATDSGAAEAEFDDVDAEDADETDAEDTDAEESAEVEDASDTQAPVKSKTHVSEKELKKIKVSDEEIEAELDELLEDAEASDEETTAAPEEQPESAQDSDDVTAEESNGSYRLNGNQ